MVNSEDYKITETNSYKIVLQAVLESSLIDLLRLYPMLTHCGQVKPYDDIDLDQQWLM